MKIDIETYDWIMLGLLVFSLIIIPTMALIRNKFLQYSPEVWNHTRLPDSRIEQIYKICRSWYASSKVWCSVYYSLNVISISASIITVYIASSFTNKQADVIFYSVVALVCSSVILVLKCETKSVKVRESYNLLCLMLAKHEMGECSDEELIDCFYECEKEITKFYI